MTTPNLTQEIEILKTNTISKRGGARIGAGRKPKLQFEARELFNMAVDERWPRIEKKMDEWIENGDKDMIKFLIEQRIGKPSQSLEVKKQEVKVNYTLFNNPKVREAVKVFEDKLKKEIMKGAIDDTDDKDDITL